ncbi:MAG: hypothetical protein ACQETL_11000 [Bacteroidota bacterium]
MKKLLLTPILLITILFYSYSQDAGIEAVGYKLDMYGKTIDGYFSTDYEGKAEFKVSKNNIRNYVPAYYFNLKNEKKEGLIKYHLKSKFFKFKASENDKAEKIKVEDCKSFVLAKDSFIVANKSLIISKDQIIKPGIDILKNESKVFLQFIEHFNGMSFYKYYTSDMNRTNVYYCLKSKNSATYEVFPTSRKDFIKFCSANFSKFPELIKEIEDRKYDDGDIPTIIKMYKYNMGYVNNDKIYFDKQWREIENEKNAKYFAKVDSAEGTSFYISYFTEDNNKLYSGNFNSVYPHKKDGDFTWYYPNGVKRKKIKYVENKPHTIFTYYRNQNIYEIYRYDDFGLRTFMTVNDSSGTNQLDENGSGLNIFYDHIEQRLIQNQYIKGYLVESYYTDQKGRKVYFLSTKDLKFKRSRWFQKQLKKKFEYPEKSFLDGNYGLVLVNLIIEPSGYVSDINILKGIDDSIDLALLDQLNIFKQGKYWRTGKVKGERIVNEVVLPIEFQFETYNPFHTWNMFWMNDMMMRQQMMMNQSFPMPPPMNFPSNY